MQPPQVACPAIKAEASSSVEEDESSSESAEPVLPLL